jgi:hypothetical protein
LNEGQFSAIGSAEQEGRQTHKPWTVNSALSVENEDDERKGRMKKRMLVLLTIVLLTLLLTVPASASKPSAVSGVRSFTPDIPSRVWRSAGSNCILNLDGVYQYTGDLDGAATTHLRIVVHGPCTPTGPVKFVYNENLHMTGTFTGYVLGEYGTFEFVEAATFRPPSEGGEGFSGRLVISSGSDALDGLHGTLDTVSGGGYSGRVHWHP